MMSILDAFLRPNKNTNRGFGAALGRLDQTQAQTNPFLQSLIQSGEQGNSYLMDLINGTSGIENNPAYQVQLNEGIGAIDASAASRGMSQSGDTLRALGDYGQRSFGDFRQREIGNAGNQIGYGLQGVNGLNQGTNQYNQLVVGQGQARDAGNAGALGNIIGAGTTLAKLAMGVPPTGGSTGRLF